MDAKQYGPWALVIGGSEGVGAAFARKLAASGFKLVLIARKRGPLEALAAQLRASSAEVRVLCADLAHPEALERARSVTDELEIGLLIYNAGANNTRGRFVELPKEVTQSVIAINVIGQADFARHYGALMCQRGRGGMILAGSLSGYMGSPTLAAYTASKAFSRIFTEALWAECKAFGVDVLHLNIGFTATPAMARLGIDISVAEAPDKVAQEGLDNIANGPLWIVSTKGNIERARKLSVVDARAELVRSFAIPPREQMADLQRRQLQSSD
ncbi:MAG TPA: SDR family NAD(P)-dependent oxidoreductase [Steroidobacteraceae bacterium]|jgi:short-subunit dehydrogenase|nr:SDR family NAD(P)-dependent oxidoreductase [Steroidobacteraceae bacterium]